MARTPNGIPSRRLNLSLNEAQVKALARMAELGLYGSTPSEIAKYFVLQGIERAVHQKALSKAREEFGESEGEGA